MYNPHIKYFNDQSLLIYSKLYTPYIYILQLQLDQTTQSDAVDRLFPPHLDKLVGYSSAGIKGNALSMSAFQARTSGAMGFIP